MTHVKEKKLKKSWKKLNQATNPQEVKDSIINIIYQLFALYTATPEDESYITLLRHLCTLQYVYEYFDTFTNQHK